jgi:hypothetical protein
VRILQATLTVSFNPEPSRSFYVVLSSNRYFDCCLLIS